MLMKKTIAWKFAVNWHLFLHPEYMATVFCLLLEQIPFISAHTSTLSNYYNNNNNSNNVYLANFTDLAKVLR